MDSILHLHSPNTSSLLCSSAGMSWSIHYSECANNRFIVIVKPISTCILCIAATIKLHIIPILSACYVCPTLTLALFFSWHTSSKKSVSARWHSSVSVMLCYWRQPFQVVLTQPAPIKVAVVVIVGKDSVLSDWFNTQHLAVLGNRRHSCADWHYKRSTCCESSCTFQELLLYCIWPKKCTPPLNRLTVIKYVGSLSKHNKQFKIPMNIFIVGYLCA